jgi:hypothetical protein
MDRLLAVSLPRLPEARSIPNLAGRAIERARMLDHLANQQRRRLAIYRWRLRFIYTAATLLIGALILLGGHRLVGERESMVSSDESISSNESTTPSTSTYVAGLGGLLFICTLAGLATESALSPQLPSPLG